MDDFSAFTNQSSEYSFIGFGNIEPWIFVRYYLKFISLSEKMRKYIFINYLKDILNSRGYFLEDACKLAYMIINPLSGDEIIDVLFNDARLAQRIESLTDIEVKNDKFLRKYKK